MKHILYIIFLIPVLSYSQNFKDYIKEAEKYFAEKAYENSAVNYEKAFKLEETDSEHYYKAAKTFALLNDTINAFFYLNKSVDNGWKNRMKIQADKDFALLKSSSQFDTILKKANENLAEYEKDFNIPLKHQLDALFYKDQTLRKLYLEVIKKFGNPSPELIYFVQLFQEQDTKNIAELKQILDEYGWVGKSEVGSLGNSAIWAVLQHADLELQKEYLPLLEVSVLKGESKGEQLALLKDRILVKENKPQIYGSQVSRSNKTVFEIEDPEYVNQRRKAIGLQPIEEYLKKYDIKWTTPQKEK